ncbi:MAG: hypothetical protein ACR5K2_01865 [Wolbachia sp.]
MSTPKIKELIAQRKPIDSSCIYATVGLAAKQGAREQDDEHIYEEIFGGKGHKNQLYVREKSVNTEKSIDSSKQEPIYVTADFTAIEIRK